MVLRKDLRREKRGPREALVTRYRQYVRALYLSEFWEKELLASGPPTSWSESGT